MPGTMRAPGADLKRFAGVVSGWLAEPCDALLEGLVLGFEAFRRRAKSSGTGGVTSLASRNLIPMRSGSRQIDLATKLCELMRDKQVEDFKNT